MFEKKVLINFICLYVYGIDICNGLFYKWCVYINFSILDYEIVIFWIYKKINWYCDKNWIFDGCKNINVLKELRKFIGLIKFLI